MKITVEDCLKLDVFKGSRVEAGNKRIDNRVRTISVFDEDDFEIGIERNGVQDQMVLTHFWSFKNDIDKQVKAVEGLGKSGIACLVVFTHEKGLKAIDERVIAAAEDNRLILIQIDDDGKRTYADMMEQVFDKILYGHNYSDNILNNTIFHLLNFDKHSNFQSALKEASLNNDYQVVIMTSEFNPILTIETRHRATIDDAIKSAKKYDITHSSTYTKVETNGVITYWGTVDIKNEKHILMIVDNEDNYSATEMKKLAEIIELAMGMWKYTPERDSRAEFIKSAIRGDIAFCHELLDEAGLRDKTFLSVFYASGINNVDCKQILDEYKERLGLGMLPLVEENEIYGMIYTENSNEEQSELKAEIIKMYDDLKEGRKDVRIFHSTGIENVENAIDGFKMINETWNYVETVFPYKRVFTKYEMSMVCNCINIQMQSPGIKKMYLDLMEPFKKEVTENKGKLLMDTLETFVLDAGMNSNKTAEFMQIHNNTVQYRLKRINELLGAEMTGNRIIPGLTMALALRRLEDK